MVGDTPEELGSGLHLGLNLIIYVLKQARYHWIPSQGSRDMENIPRQQLLVRFYSQNEGENGLIAAVEECFPYLGNPVTEANG